MKMKRGVVSLTILFFWLASGFGFPATTETATNGSISVDSDANGLADRMSFQIQAPTKPPSSDRDYDGLIDDVETSGWWNAAGFFTTDPLDPDCDDDGLTDGQEKLYDADPHNDRSPGIYVEYENHLKTRQYFAKEPYSVQPWGWQRYGDRFIGLDAVVVRRGATFYVGGPPGATIQIRKSLGYLTTLVPMRDACNGRWRVYVPSGGTVGKYQITLQEGDWSASLNLYVIFELPTPTSRFTQAMINAFLYDDEPGNLRDETGILLNSNGYEYTHDDYPSHIPEGAWINSGYCYKFQLQQFEPFVFEEHVIEAINGHSNPWGAANALVAHADKVTRFDHPRALTSSWAVLHPGSNDKNQCSNISGLLAAFERSAGIPARSFFVDRAHRTFDHSVEVWLYGAWYSARGFRVYEPEGCGWDCGYGYRALTSRGSYGRTFYAPWHSGGGGSLSVVAAADENWPWDLGSSLIEYRWPSWDWDVIARYDWFETLFVPYWSYLGWTREPRDIGSPWDWPPVTGFDVNASSTSVGEVADHSPPGLTVRGVNDYGLDLDGDGYFDQLVIEIEVNAMQPGTYWFQADLGVDSFGRAQDGQQDPTLVGTGGVVAAAVVRADLVEGTQTVQLPFDGLQISAAKVDGPYVLKYLSITDVDDPGPDEFANNSLGHWRSLYTTAAYQAYDFQNRGAALSGTVAERGLDADGDGLYEALALDVGLNIFVPGTYTVQGDLYDSREGFVARATWSSGVGAASAVASLQFEGLAGTRGPYMLEEVYLLNAEGEIIDSMLKAYTTQQVIEAEGKTRIVDQPDLSEIEAQAISGTYSDYGLDLGSDGLYDWLVINVQVEAEEADLYRLEGWLEDEDDSLVSWTSSDTISLTVGTHNLPLVFNGPVIHAHNTDGPFTLMALKLIRGDAYEVVDEVDVAYTTSAYTHDQFRNLPHLERPAGYGILFKDHLESGGDYWTADWPWALVMAKSYDSTHFWTDSPGGNYANNRNVSLTTVPINLLAFNRLTLHFETCYDLETDHDYGHVDISTDDGVTWTPVVTYTGRTAHWSSKKVDLGTMDGAETLRVRFRLETDAGTTADGWYIDDVAIHNVAPILPLILK